MKLRTSNRMRLLATAMLFLGAASGCGDGGSLPAAPSPAPAPAPLIFGAFPAATVVIGQSGFDAVAPDGTPGTLSLPRGEPAIAGDGRLFVADSGSSSLKVFSRYDQMNAEAVDFPALTSPKSASIRSGRLVVVDGDKVRIFESPTPGAPEISVAGNSAVCSATGLRAPASAYLAPTGQLIVADSANHRVLIWNQLPASPLTEAHVVLGQRTMNTCAANDDGDDNTDIPSASTMFAPSSVWSDGKRLVVADSGNHRVLIWETLPTSSAQPATTVLGQRSFAEVQADAGELNPSSMSLERPRSVDVSEAGQLAVADQQNNRVLVWDRMPAPGAHAQPADQVLGQAGFDIGESGPPSVKTLSEPAGLRFHGRDLVVVDQANSRVLVWRATN